ncbi:MAG: hypothetical protein KKI09_07600 [Spirochaetes bacterium]|nr:hypothetical protein [Spirochaetota bacterium]
MREMLPYIPLRFRGGLGYWPGRDFSIILGMELGLLELLNGYQARMFGLYAMIDGILRVSAIHTEADYRPALKLLFGINNLSCLGIGAAWDNTLGWMLKLDYSAGIYLLK